MTTTLVAPAEERPIGRAGFLGTWLALLVTLSVVSFLRNQRALPTGFWELDSKLYDLAFDSQLFLMALGVAALRVVPARYARCVLFVEGLACIACYGLSGAVYVAGLLLWFLALEIPAPPRVRLLVPLFLMVAAGLLGANHLVKGLFLFSITFTPRLMMYTWDKWQKDWPRGNWRDFATYVLAPPLVVFPPYVVIIPYYGNHAAESPKPVTVRLARRALASFGIGLLSAVGLLALSAVMRAFPPPPLLARVYVIYLRWVLEIGAVAYLACGLLFLHGFVDERPPLTVPFFATNYVQVWNRFQVHQKDLQVSFFYLPTLLKLRRRNRYVAILAATTVTMTLGNTVIHALARYMYRPAWWMARMLPNAIFLGSSVVVLGGTLCFQEWQRRTKWKAPGGIVGALFTIVSWAFTLTFTAFLISL